MNFKSIRIVFMAAMIGIIGLSGCKGKAAETASADDGASGAKALVCYFSATGTTRAAAERIAKLTGSDIHEIVPAEIYTDADLDWRDSLSRSSVEMRNRTFRPALKDSVTDLSEYSVIFIGYPNWWNTHPTIINTFIEANDLQNKLIVPFMTSGGSNITNSEKELHESYPTLNIAKGLLMNSVTDDDISRWIDESARL